MSDGQLLLIVLGAFTFYECIRWVAVRTWVFQSLDGERWNASRPWEMLRSRGGGMVMLMPLPPLPAHVATAAWPCVPHENGLCFWNDESGAARHVPWAHVAARAEGAVLHLSPEHRVRCTHAASAEAWAKEANAWTKQGQEQRRESFLKRAAAMLDVESLTEAALKLEKGTRRMRRLGGWIFILCFVVLPVVYWRFADTWPTLAAAAMLLVMMMTQTMLLRRQVRNEPRLQNGAWQHLISTALFPPSSMRAADWICGVCSPEAHPLAALKAWGKEDEVRQASARTWREARWPAGDFPGGPWNGPEVAALSSFFEVHRIKSETYDAAPALAEGCTRWCPRCHTSYHETATVCTDCAGMKLLS